VAKFSDIRLEIIKRCDFLSILLISDKFWEKPLTRPNKKLLFLQRFKNNSKMMMVSSTKSKTAKEGAKVLQ